MDTRKRQIDEEETRKDDDKRERERREDEISQRQGKRDKTIVPILSAKYVVEFYCLCRGD